MFDIPEALKRKMFGIKGEDYNFKIVNDLTPRCRLYEGTQAIEYPRHSALSAQDQREYLNFWLQVGSLFKVVTTYLAISISAVIFFTFCPVHLL